MKRALKQLRNRWNAILGLDAKRDKLDAEVEHHLELLAREFESEGMSSKEAMRAARKRFGGVDHLKEECQENWGVLWLENIGRNIRRSSRRLLKDSGFTTTALLTLALCLGANLTIFAVVDSVLLRPLPFPNADRLVLLYNTYPNAGVNNDNSSITNYYERRNVIEAFSSLSMFSAGTAIIGPSGSTQRENIMRVTPEFFTTLGVELAMGRVFREEETTYQTDGVAILTDAYWRERYDASTEILDESVFVDGYQKRIIGVLPPEYRLLSSNARLYFPLASDLARRAPDQRHNGGARETVARLKPGVPLSIAQAQVDAHNTAMEKSNPAAKFIKEAGFRTPTVSLHGNHVASIRPMLLLIQIGALCLLLIGAVNLVNLLLIRASERSKEIAIGQALGAGRTHILGEVLVEAILLALVGGFLGLLAAMLGIQIIATLGASELPLGARIAVNSRTVWSALAGAIVFGIAMAIPMAWFSIRNSSSNSLSVESRSATTSAAAQRVRHMFIVAQIALAFVLLSGSALLGISLYQAMLVDPGFQADKLVSSELTLPYASYSNNGSPAQLAFIDHLLENLENNAGISAAGIATNIPFSGYNSVEALKVKNYVAAEGISLQAHYSVGVSGNYFSTMGILLREGRFINSDDSRRDGRFCVVDESFANRYWPDKSPLGYQLFNGPNQESIEEAFTIVGVVNDAKHAELTEAGGQGVVYFPYKYKPIGHIYVMARTSHNTDFLSKTLQDAVRSIDPDLPIDGIILMSARIEDSLAGRRSPFLLTTVFAAVALVLASVGTYGALAYSVGQRRREIGIRLAIGARPERIQKQFLMLGVKLFAVGGILGVAGALAAGRAMQSILFEVPSIHTPTLLGTVVVMGTVTLLACLIPAYQAARVSPAETLGDA